MISFYILFPFFFFLPYLNLKTVSVIYCLHSISTPYLAFRAPLTDVVWEPNPFPAPDQLCQSRTLASLKMAAVGVHVNPALSTSTKVKHAQLLLLFPLMETDDLLYSLLLSCLICNDFMLAKMNASSRLPLQQK